MSVAQRWLGLMFGLGAMYLVFSNPNGVYKAGQTVRNVVGGTEADIISGGAK